MPRSVMDFGGEKVRKILFVLHEAYCTGENTPRKIIVTVLYCECSQRDGHRLLYT